MKRLHEWLVFPLSLLGVLPLIPFFTVGDSWGWWMPMFEGTANTWSIILSIPSLVGGYLAWKLLSRRVVVGVIALTIVLVTGVLPWIELLRNRSMLENRTGQWNLWEYWTGGQGWVSLVVYLALVGILWFCQFAIPPAFRWLMKYDRGVM